MRNSEFQTGASPSAVTNFTISNILRLQNSPSQQAISIKLTDDCFETLQRAARENHEVLVHIDKKGITIEIKTSSSFIKFDCFVQRVSGSVFRVLQRSQNTYNDIANIAMRAQVKPTEKTFQSSRSKAEALSKHLEKESSKCRTQMLQAPVKANDKKYNFTNISKVMGKSSTPSPRNGSSLSSVASSSPVQSNTKISSPMNALSNNSKSSSLKERVIHYIICGKFNNPDDIVDHIISEGLPSNIIADSARRKIREIICEVAEEYRNPPKLVLLPKYHQQVDLNWPFFTSEERSKAQNSLAETTLEAGNNFAPLRASTRGPLVAPKSKTKKVSTPPAMTNSTTTSPEIASDGSISMTPSPAEQSQIIINDHRPVSSMPKRKKDDIKSDKMDMSDDVPPTKKHRSDAKEHSGSNKERPKKDNNLSNEINRILDKSEMKKNGDSTRKEAEKIVHSSNDKHGFESGSSSKLPFEERKKSKKNGDETSETSKSKEKEKRNKSSNAEKQSKSTSKSKHDSEFSTNLPTSSSSKSQNFIESGSKSKEKNSSKSKKNSSSAQNSDESKSNSETRKKDYVKNESEKKEKSRKSGKEWDADEKLKDKKEKRSKEEKKVVDDSNVQKTDRKNKDGEKSKKVEEILPNDAVKKTVESKKSEKSSEAKADKKRTMPTTTDVPKTKSEKAEKDKKSESKTKNKNDQTKCNEKSSKEPTKEKHEKIKESNKKIVADLKTMSIRDLLNLLSEPVKPSKNYEEKYPPIRNVADAKTYQDHEIKYYEDYQKAYKYLRTIEKDLGTLVERLNNSTTDYERENIEDKIRNYATHCTQDSSYKNQRQIVANMTSAIEVLRNRLSVFYGQNQQLQ